MSSTKIEAKTPPAITPGRSGWLSMYRGVVEVGVTCVVGFWVTKIWVSFGLSNPSLGAVIVAYPVSLYGPHFSHSRNH